MGATHRTHRGRGESRGVLALEDPSGPAEGEQRRVIENENENKNEGDVNDNNVAQ